MPTRQTSAQHEASRLVTNSPISEIIPSDQYAIDASPLNGELVRSPYWKLGSMVYVSCAQIKVCMKERGYHIKCDHRKDRLLEHFFRCQRRLPSYEGCDRAELVKFTKCRQLLMQRVKYRTRAELIDALESPDE